MASPWGQQLALPASYASTPEWSELKTPDGRSYYFNRLTNQTTWDKPDALKTPAEVRLSKIPWKEFSTPEGRKYWNNKDTGESVWTMPQSYKDALNGPAKANGTSTALTLQTYIPVQNTEDENTPGTEAYYNKEEAKKDFVRLLRKTDIMPNSKWTQIMPEIIKNPAYRAVKDPVERKSLFENYLQTLQKETEEKEKDRWHRVREGFMQMCRRHPDINYYTRYKTAVPILQDETDFKAAKDDDERRELFDEFRAEALQIHGAKENEERTKAMKVFREILEGLELEPYARWLPTKELYERKIQEEGKQGDLVAMTRLDYLTVFEDYVKELEKKFNEVRQAEKDAKYRQERKNRDGFNALLQELVRKGIIVEGAKWKDIFPLIKDDERFINMLGQAGSTPLELFWDVVEQLDTDFRLKRDYVLDVLEEKRFEVTETTNFEEFKSLMSSEPRTSMIPAQLLERIFTNLVNKFRRYSSRQSRKKPDAFRSLLRHLSEVTYDSTWEIIRPLVAEKEEFKALESDEERVAVFDKVIRRLKEKRDEERKYRERDESTRVSKRERGESVQRDGLHESKSRRRYEDDEWERSRDRSQPRSPERSRPRSRDRKDRSRDRDPIREREKERYRDRSRGYSRRDELDYEEPSRDRSKRRSDNDLRAGERKRPRKDALDYGEREDGEVSEEGEIHD